MDTDSRLRYLERRTRLLTAVLVVAVSAVTVSLLAGAGPWRKHISANTIEARALIIVDSQGNAVARLSAYSYDPADAADSSSAESIEPERGALFFYGEGEPWWLARRPDLDAPTLGLLREAAGLSERGESDLKVIISDP